MLIATALFFKDNIPVGSKFKPGKFSIHVAGILRNMYTHNHIPKGERTLNIILSAILLTYGIFGLMKDDLYIPGKRTRGVHLHGISTWIMFAAFLCGAVNLLTVVLDHYDKRNNETNYRLFAKFTQILGWTLFVVGLFYDQFKNPWGAH